MANLVSSSGREPSPANPRAPTATHQPTGTALGRAPRAAPSAGRLAPRPPAHTGAPRPHHLSASSRGTCPGDRGVVHPLAQALAVTHVLEGRGSQVTAGQTDTGRVGGRPRKPELRFVTADPRRRDDAESTELQMERDGHQPLHNRHSRSVTSPCPGAAAPGPGMRGAQLVDPLANRRVP